jgi:type IV pilus assembly protein PilA
MKWLLSKKMKFAKNQKGLTLVELLAVIVILGVIAAIAVPTIGGVISKSKTNSDVQTEILLRETAVRYMNDTAPNGPTQASVSVSTLVDNNYLQVAPTKQSATPAATYTSVPVGYTATAGWTSTGTITTTP